tara:strand:+ start:9754 stop:10278 length:525 start_codon:yes stop_codon:yes gene_type:complete
MFNTRFLIYAITIAVFVAPHSVKAGRDDDEVPAHIQRKYDRRLEEMKTLDTNQDGILQTDELKQKSKTSFNGADTDKDGILSKKEIEAARENTKKKSKEKYDSKNLANRHAMKTKVQLKNADKNDDGKVSQEEYEAYYGARHNIFDRDGDGVVTEKEYRSDLEKLPGSYRKELR